MSLSRHVVSAGLAACCVLALACSVHVDATEEQPLDSVQLDPIFDRVANDTGVPAALLKAISYTETRWQMVEGAEHNGSRAAFGLMGLRGQRLLDAASLAGLDPDDVRYDEESTIRAAAALLSDLAETAGIDRDDIGAWAKVVGKFSGIEDADARDEYVLRGVYGALRSGAQLTDEEGTRIVTLEPHTVIPDYPPLALEHAAGPDYSGSVWRPSPNYNYRPSGSTGVVRLVVIHTCEGSYAGCWGWLRNTAAGASAHYVVSKSGSEITQLVRESRRAWHVAASYSSSRNGGKLSWLNGVSTNHFSIGIEHAGYASQGSFPSGQINASAKLVCNITKDHSITRDRYHIVGHGQLQPWNRTDPGPNWPWTHYINRVRAYCGSGGGGGGGGGGSGSGSIIIDSNNSRNDTAKAKIEVSSTWRASNSTSGYYGTGYWWASTQPVSDGAVFWFKLPAAANKTIDAWWTAGTNRSTRAPFVAFDASGHKLGTATKNQQVNGRRWNKLGTWHFTKGWNKIILSRWTSESKVVIADALRVR